ncbi:unnamed protein product [Camellia sinensis]
MENNKCGCWAVFRKSVRSTCKPSASKDTPNTIPRTSFVYDAVEYNAKLSDFGLAKVGPQGDKTHVSTRVVGTYGYAALEYVMTGSRECRASYAGVPASLFVDLFQKIHWLNVLRSARGLILKVYGGGRRSMFLILFTVHQSHSKATKRAISEHCGVWTISMPSYFYCFQCIGISTILAVKLRKRMGLRMWVKLHLLGMHVEGKDRS